MKVFAVYAKVELIQKPDWLDSFRAEYDEPFEYHVTLKQPVFVEENKVFDVKNKLAQLFSNFETSNHEILLTFDSLQVPEYTPDACIMINATNTEEINKLQKSILSVLSEYNSFYEIRRKEYEENFKPHITIAQGLDEQTYLKAKKELERDYKCLGSIKEVVLAVVDNPITDEARKDTKNQTIYRFG